MIDVTLRISLDRYGPELDPHDVTEAVANVITAHTVRWGGAIAVAPPTNALTVTQPPTFYVVKDVEVVEVRGE